MMLYIADCLFVSKVPFFGTTKNSSMETDPWLKKTAAITDPHLLPLFVMALWNHHNILIFLKTFIWKTVCKYDPVLKLSEGYRTCMIKFTAVTENVSLLGV